MRPHLRAFPAAGLAGKSWLKIGQEDLMRPTIAADRSPVAAMIVAAIDQQATNSSSAHIRQGDF